MPAQSSRHLMMIEPKVFYLNPETADTNHYQHDARADHAGTLAAGLAEFRDFRDALVANGVIVTTAPGSAGCPDHVFPNWISTHEDRRMVVYPMLNPNRRAEKTPEIVGTLKKSYDVVLDMSRYEGSGLALEANGSLVLDRVNRIAYAGLSPRTSERLVHEWADAMGYRAVTFNTRDHTGSPVYHTDLIIFIGTEAAGICAPCIVEEDRDRVLSSLRATHDVIEFGGEQLRSFCGNALEVLGEGGAPMLAVSAAARASWSKDQEERLKAHFARFIEARIPTLEEYGGGSARCTLMELF